MLVLQEVLRFCITNTISETGEKSSSTTEPPGEVDLEQTQGEDEGDWDAKLEHQQPWPLPLPFLSHDDILNIEDETNDSESVYEGQEGLVCGIIKDWNSLIPPSLNLEVSCDLSVLPCVNYQRINCFRVENQTSPWHKVDT